MMVPLRFSTLSCGTGDLSIELKKYGQSKVIGSDFCRPMLDIAQQKGAELRIPFLEGDALNMPFGDGEFDAVTIAFGLRNLANVEAGLRELTRITKPGGTLAIRNSLIPLFPASANFLIFTSHTSFPALAVQSAAHAELMNTCLSPSESFPTEVALPR